VNNDASVCPAKVKTRREVEARRRRRHPRLHSDAAHRRRRGDDFVDADHDAHEELVRFAIRISHLPLSCKIAYILHAYSCMYTHKRDYTGV
jgi:hypothetical protein